MVNYGDQHKALIDPFEDRDIEWRVQMSGISGQGKPWAMVIPYITNRAIQQRLDDVFGFDGWKNEYKETADKKGYLCGISFRNERGEWLTKWDGAEYSNIEPLKGALSGAMKRAAVQLGIGRYLYNLNEEFAQCELVGSRFEVKDPWNYISVKNKQNKNAPPVSAKWLPPVLPEWALPSFKSEQYIEQIKSAQTLDELQKVYTDAMRYAKSFLKSEFAKAVNELTKAKKTELLNTQESTAAGKASKMLDWTKTRIENYINEASNESVVKQMKSQITGEIHEHCQKGNLKPDTYLALVDSSCKKRLSQLKQPQEC